LLELLPTDLFRSRKGQPESNPKDSGDEALWLLDKPLAYPPDPLDGRVLSGRQEEKHMKQVREGLSDQLLVQEL